MDTGDERPYEPVHAWVIREGARHLKETRPRAYAGFRIYATLLVILTAAPFVVLAGLLLGRAFNAIF